MEFRKVEYLSDYSFIVETRVRLWYTKSDPQKMRFGFQIQQTL